MYNPKTYWDEIGRRSAPGIGDSAGKFGSNQKGESLFKLPPWSKLPPFLEYLKQGQSVLDLGSGIGICVGKLTELGFKAVGCDISSALLDVARKNCLSHGISNSMFVQYDGYELPFKSNSFDRIIANAVLQHIIEENALRKFFSETKRILKSQGLLVICQSVCNWNVKPAPHVLLRSPKIYELMAVQNGLRLKTLKHIISSYVLMKVVYRWSSGSAFSKKPKFFNVLESCKKTGFYLSKIMNPLLNRLGCHFLASQATMVFEKRG